jgi:hypothetical protein
MARIIFCLTLLLQACASHVVRCDAHLQPINAPRATPAEKAADVGETVP